MILKAHSTFFCSDIDHKLLVDIIYETHMDPNEVLIDLFSENFDTRVLSKLFNDLFMLFFYLFQINNNNNKTTTHPYPMWFN